MASVEAFETMLKDVIQAKRLSASKMNSLTEIAMKTMEHDTQLVSVLYRTHKSLLPSAKVSSLYIFDALCRAARHHASKQGIIGDINSTKGNSATFLLKVEGVLEGLFQDMILIGTSESKEKTKKILDIWVKGNTFPSHILSRLTDIMEGKEQASTTKPQNNGLPAAPVQPVTISTSNSVAPSMDPQATLLALLAQAAHTSAVPSQTVTNTGQGGLDAAQLAVLQQLALAQTANNAAPSQSAQNPSKQGDSAHFGAPSSQRGVSLNEYQNERRPDMLRSPERVNTHDDYFSRPCPRGSFKGGFRARRRGEGRRWDDRDRDRYRDRERNERSPVRRPRRSRSGSPPGRFLGRRDVRHYSPPRQPVGCRRHESIRDPDKDEFGRDIRPQSPDSDKSLPKTNISPPPPPTPPVASAPTPTAPFAAFTPQTAPFDTTTKEKSPSPVGQSNHDRMSLTTSVAANTSSNTHNARMFSSTDSTQPGMENFNPATFDFTSPASWEALGKMWQVTHGVLPSTENLMQFVVTSQAQASMVNSFNWSIESVQKWDSSNKDANGVAPDCGGYYENGKGRTGHSQLTHDNNSQDTNSTVLESGQNPTAEIMDMGTKQESQIRGAGGRMQKVGDKWVFVRDPTS